VQIGWPEIPARSGVCGEGVPIGMVDTGINDRHDTFRGARMEVTRLTPDGLDPATAVHGTAVAALFVGDPGSRSPGLIPGARLVAVDAFHRAGTDERADVFALVAALDLLADSEVRVVNLSLAGPPNDVLAEAIARLSRDRDILFVAAAGNGGPAADPQYPAAYPEVLAVTAVDRRFEPWRRAARGEHVDLAAPGVDVWTAASIRGARTKTGTSFAAPFVSAAAALVRAQFPDLTADEVRAALIATAADLGNPGRDDVYGAGLLSSSGLCQ
jgi:subtilisin family serine protease